MAANTNEELKKRKTKWIQKKDRENSEREKAVPCHLQILLSKVIYIKPKFILPS